MIMSTRRKEINVDKEIRYMIKVDKEIRYMINVDKEIIIYLISLTRR